MDAALLATLITASVSLILAVGKIVWDWREKKHERRLQAREKLDKYRAPLLASVDELGRRLHNIRHDGFLAYLDSDDRRETALLSTHFRFAQYFGWTEIIYGYSHRLQFEADDVTAEVTNTLGEIARTLASDKFDRVDAQDFTSTRFLLWREEQRAIGELMREGGDEPRCIGFNTFATAYESRFSKWFASFEADLRRASASDSHRLRELQRVVARLARQLDVDGVLVQTDRSGKIVSPSWVRMSDSS
jgi:hypothetical protein